MHLARTTRRLALLAALGGAALSATTGTALADSQCSYDPSFHRVNVWDGSGSADLRIARSGQYIVVKDGASGPMSYCSSSNGVATVTNTDKVIVDGNATSPYDGFVLDESGGELGPGWTPEGDGKSETEVTFRNSPYNGKLELGVVGSSGPDTIKLAGGSQVKIGNDNDVDAQVISNVDSKQLSAHFKYVDGRGGDDTVSAAENVPTSYGGWTELYGGPGNNTLVGGQGHDKMYGGTNDDDLRAFGGGYDIVSGEGGYDSATADTTDSVFSNVEWKVLG